MTLLLVSRNFLFPYVTVKGFAFRSVVLLVGAAWGGLLVLNRKRYTPPWNRVSIALGILLASTIASAVFGINSSRSFWSNFERMEGVVLYLHLFLLFCALSGTFRSAREWHGVFYATIAVGAAMSLENVVLAFMTQSAARAASTFGNAQYLAIYLVFQLFLLFFFFIRTTHWWMRRGAAGIIVLHIAALLLTGARGVFFGFLAGCFVMFGAWMFMRFKRFWKRLLFSGIALVVLSTAILFQFSSSDALQDTARDNALSRLTKISFSNTSVQTRLLTWEIAWRAFLDRPAFGWGSDNFIAAFTQYYNPRLYGYELWYDRAHSVLFDWLVAGGAVGIVSLVAFFSVLVWTLITATRRRSFSHGEAVVFAGLGVAYGIQMFVNFDTLSTYLVGILLIGFFAFTLAHRDDVPHRMASAGGYEPARISALRTVHYESPTLSSALSTFFRIIRAKARNSGECGTGGICGNFTFRNSKLRVVSVVNIFLFAFILFFFITLRPLLAARTTISASRIAGNSAESQRLFARAIALARGTIGTTEIREQMVRSLFAVTTQERLQNDASLQAFYRFTIGEMGEEQGVKALLSRARLWYIKGIFLRDRVALAQSLALYQQALARSPNYIPLYPLLAEAFAAGGDIARATALLDSAVSRVGKPHRYNTDIFYTKPLLYVTLGEYDRALQTLQHLPSSVRTKALEPSEKGLRSIIQTARILGGEKAISFLEHMHTLWDPASAVPAIALAEMYGETGQYALSRAYAKEAFARDPASADSIYPLLRRLR